MPETTVIPAPRRQASLRLALFWQRCDTVSGALLCAMVIFSPWAFGNATPWAILTMNVAGCGLGVLLAIKLFIRWFWNYRPPRWDDVLAISKTGARVSRWFTRALAALTFAILAYCAVSAFNARSSYDPQRAVFAYHNYVSWLPHSYDRHRTWRYFFNYLALALSFWAARDWLLGRTPADSKAARESKEAVGPGVLMPARLRRLLWVLGVNGALLGGEALLQRLSGTGKLLWLVEPRLNAFAEAQLGPFNYRSNGAQYLNLIWPVTLGLWWRLRRMARLLPKSTSWLRRSKHHVLLLCVLIMAATSVLSLSRGGAAVAVMNMLLATGILWIGWRRHGVLPRLGILLFFGAAFGLGLYISGGRLAERLKEADEGLVKREEMYDTARTMAKDYPLFGVGPGAFDPVFQLYRQSEDEYWPAQLHNDWLETLITFGWFGSALIGMAFVLVLARYFLPGGIATGWRLVSLIWVALSGCLLHARWDFPLQMYSILFVFLLLCAMLTTFSRRTLAVA